MRYVILVKATPESEAGAPPEESLVHAMADYHERLSQAGVFLDASRLRPSVEGWRIRYAGGTRTVLDGPFAETKELVAGYTLIETKTREEAVEWARRFPNPSLDHGAAEIEVRQLFELEDFEPNKALQRFEAIKEINR